MNNNKISDKDIVVSGYNEANATIVKVSRVSYKYNTIRVTIKQSIADLANIGAGDDLEQYYDSKKGCIVLKKIKKSGQPR